MNHWLSGGLLAALLSTPAWAIETPPVNADEDPGASPAAADTTPALELEPIVVTTALMQDPYTLTLDPRQSRLPLPASDGGSFLKSIPGFALSRKGGTSGDPVLRGLGGSRLNILVDDTTLLGGCGGRMDPPTAYVFPEAYDEIEVLKGPQSVRYGASTAGVVRFERKQPEFERPGLDAYVSSTLGSFDRLDFTGEAIAGGERGYGRFTGTWSSQDDYEDGHGESVHSQYERWSASTVLGWTPDERTWVEFILDRSDGEAAYDDRMMDGTRFDRTAYTLKAERRDLRPWLASVEGMLYYNYIDHVMDNFSLRQPPMMRAINYPDRRTRGGRLAAELVPGAGFEITAGIDWMDNRHRDNSLRGPAVANFGSVPREENAEFSDTGAFFEASHGAGARGRITFGLRTDHSRAEALAAEGFGGVAPGSSERSRQVSGFARYSHELEGIPLVLYSGLGRAERIADYWERQRVFGLDPEVLNQLDLGARYQRQSLTATLALFYGEFDDYILVSAPGVNPQQAQNVDAVTWGGEADMRYRFSERLSLTATAAWVHSENETAHRPLAQTPPLEGTLSLDYDNERWSAGALLRAVARQDRIHPGYGTIYSLDTTETPGFAVASIYAGKHLGERWTLAGGIDNLFDRYYEEHIQRGAADLGATAARVPEPGRSLWLRLNGRF